MSTHPSYRAQLPLNPVLVFGVLALVLALRLLHLSSALQSPLSYQPGPDEDYYLRFGEAVASGRGADAAEFTFMDPAFGYLLGAIFKLLGINVFAVYLLQALLDTATAYGILQMGRMLDRPRAGLYGALLYGLVATAIMFCAALVKEIWVASFMTWWVVSALAVRHSERKLAWLAFGAFCGAGIALRSTLLLLGLCSLLLPVASDRKSWMAKLALLLVGMGIALAPWSVRNYRAFGSASPLPHNGGIVLHQIYNPQNPTSSIWIPSFVNYLHPSEIWRGYAAEAQRRTGSSLTPPAVDRYWRGEAVRFIDTHPGEVLSTVTRKSVEFLSATEVPNNRSPAEERMFSSVLRILPPPSAWLLAMGLAGLLWFATNDPRWPIVAAPIVVSWATFAVFWAEDRFRFHAVPLLAFCSGLWIDALRTGLVGFRRQTRRTLAVPAFGLLAVLIVTVALYLGTHFPPPPIRWDHVVWGYIKMGKTAEARSLAERIAAEQPDDAPLVEALAFLAATDGRYDEAERDYRRAIELRPRSYLAHYNLAKIFLLRGNHASALREARLSMQLSPSADAAALLAQIEATP